MATMRIYAIAALLIGIAVVPSITLAAPVQYEITDLGTLGGPRSYAYAINNLGQIAGESNTGIATYAFRWDAGQMTALTGSSGNTYARDINNAGLVVGWAMVGNDPQACLWSGSSKITIGWLGSGRHSWAYGINNWGQVVGEATHDEIYHQGVSPWTYGFIWDNGTMSESSPRIGEGRGINDSGDIAGGSLHSYKYEIHYACVVINGVKTVLSNTQDTYAADINNARQIIYQSSLWENGSSTSLNGSLHAINEHGHVVGSAMVGVPHAMFWDNTPGHPRTDLNTLIPSDSGWAYLAEAYDINDNGQIVGYGRLVGSSFDRAFLLTPVPEPATLGLLASGALALLRKHRTRRHPPTW